MPGDAMKNVLLALCLGAMLAGCMGRSQMDQSALAPEIPEEPEAQIFVLAPVEYMRYIGVDGPILLASEGRWSDLPVYATPEEALAAEREFEARNELAPGIWQVYRLNGIWDEDVVEIQPGQWRMRHPAEILPCS